MHRAVRSWTPADRAGGRGPLPSVLERKGGRDSIPARVLDALGVRPGDRIELRGGPDGFLLRPRRIDCDRLGTLRSKLRGGQGAFDVEAFRDEPHDPALRD